MPILIEFGEKLTSDFSDCDRDVDGRVVHRPRFEAQMRRINESAGTNITIHHNFHAEVRHCQKRIARKQKRKQQFA